MKEYNKYELRFLQVLVPEKKYNQIVLFNYHQMIERAFWEGSHDHEELIGILQKGTISDLERWDFDTTMNKFVKVLLNDD